MDENAEKRRQELLKNYVENLQENPGHGIERDLYQRGFYQAPAYYDGKLHEGKVMQGPLTGIEEIDRHHTVNYKVRPFGHVDVKKGIYENFKEVALENKDKVIVYEGINPDNRRYTYVELLDRIDKTASGFEKMGLGIGSRIACMGTNSLDEIITLLSSLKIGATYIPIDCSKGDINAKSNVEKSHADLLIMENPILFKHMDETKVGFSESIKYFNCLNVPVVLSDCTFELPKVNGLYRLTDIQELGKDKQSTTAEYDTKRVSLILKSSGTTGPSKDILESEHGVLEGIQRVLYSDYQLGNPNFLLKVIPSHIGFGLVGTMLSGLMSNTSLIMTRGKSIEENSELVMQDIRGFKAFLEREGLDTSAKLNLFVAPQFGRDILDKIDTFDNFDNLGSILSGGARLDASLNEEFHREMSKKGYHNYINNVYGQNEQNATTLNSESGNKVGTIGFPAIGTNIFVINDEDKSFANIGEEGTIVEMSDAAFMGYNDPEKTKSAYVKIGDSALAFDTQDVGKMDEEGYITHLRRSGRVATRCNQKLSLEDVETKIKSNKNVRECALVSLTQEKSENDILVLYIVNKEPISDEQLCNECGINDEFQRPDFIVLLEQLPHLGSGKVDYYSLKKMASEEYLKNPNRLR